MRGYVDWPSGTSSPGRYLPHAALAPIHTVRAWSLSPVQVHRSINWIPQFYLPTHPVELGRWRHVLGNSGRGRQVRFLAWINPRTTSRDHFGQALHRGRASSQLPRAGLFHAREPVISDTHVAETRQVYCAGLYFKDIWDTSMRVRPGARPTCMLLAGWLVVGNRLKQCGVQR